MKKILAILLTVCMVVCMIPGAAFADPAINLEKDVTVSITDASNNEIQYYDKSVVGTTKEEQGDFLSNENKIGKIVVKKDGTDITTKCIIDKAVSTNTVRITIKGNGTDTTGLIIKDFDIVSEAFDNTNYFISNSAVASSATSILADKVFTGAGVEQTIYVYKKDVAKGNILINSSMYSVGYSSNINVGTAEITITGKNGARGTITNGFIIKAADFSDVVVTAPNTENENKAGYDVIAKLNGNTLTKGTDYTLSFKKSDGTTLGEDENFIKGNKYTVVVKPSNNGNFKDVTKTKELSFKVNKELGGVTITGTSFIYDGTKKVPTVTMSTTGVKENVDYTISYFNEAGTKVANPIDAGKYTVVVEAIDGNKNGLEGIKEATFTIDPIYVQSTNSNEANYVYMDNIAEQKYTGTALRPSVTVYYQEKPSTTKKTLIKDKDYTVTYTNNTAIGTGKATVSFKGNYRALGSDLTKNFIITKGTLLTAANTTISGVNDTYDYTGYAIKPTVYVTYRSGYTTKVLTQSTTTRTYDYKVDYSSNIAAGTATITVTGQGEYAGTVTKTFAIKYNLSNATVTATPSTYLYDGKEKKPLVSVKVGYMVVPASNYNVVYSNNTNTGTAAVTVTAKKYGNAIGSNSAYFTIKGKDGVITPEYAEFSKKTTKSNPFAIKIVSNTTDGTGYSYVSSDTSVATVSANGTVTPVGCGRTVITITTTGNKAYNPATATVTVTVKPTKGIISSLKSTAKGKLTVRYKKQSPNADYYQIRYGRAGDYTTKTIKNTTALTGKSTIKSLNSGKKYYVKVRGVKVLEDGTRLYGTWSVTKNAVTK